MPTPQEMVCVVELLLSTGKVARVSLKPHLGLERALHRAILLAKRAGGGAMFVFLANAIAVVLYAPLLIAVFYFQLRH